jgi:hypothetical protein
LKDGLPQHIRGNIEAMVMELWDGSFAIFAGISSVLGWSSNA